MYVQEFWAFCPKRIYIGCPQCKTHVLLACTADTETVCNEVHDIWPRLILQGNPLSVFLQLTYNAHASTCCALAQQSSSSSDTWLIPGIESEMSAFRRGPTKRSRIFLSVMMVIDIRASFDGKVRSRSTHTKKRILTLLIITQWRATP